MSESHKSIVVLNPAVEGDDTELIQSVIDGTYPEPAVLGDGEFNVSEGLVFEGSGPNLKGFKLRGLGAGRTKIRFFGGPGQDFLNIRPPKGLSAKVVGTSTQTLYCDTGTVHTGLVGLSVKTDGFTTAYNNGTFEIIAADPIANTITYINALVGNDESGASGTWKVVYSPLAFCQLADFSVIQDDPTEACNFLALTSVKNVRVTGVEVEDFGDRGVFVDNKNDDFDQVSEVQIEDCVFRGVKNEAVDLGDSPITSFDITRNRVIKCGGGIIGKPYTLNVQNNVFAYCNASAAIKIQYDNGSSPRQPFFLLNKFEGNQYGDIWLASVSSGATCINNNFNTNFGGVTPTEWYAYRFGEGGSANTKANGVLCINDQFVTTSQVSSIPNSCYDFVDADAVKIELPRFQVLDASTVKYNNVSNCTNLVVYETNGYLYEPPSQIDGSERHAAAEKTAAGSAITSLGNTDTVLPGTWVTGEIHSELTIGTAKITYTGDETRKFRVSGWLSFDTIDSANTLIAGVAKNGTRPSNQDVRFTMQTSNSYSVPVSAVVELEKDDYLELVVRTLVGTSNLTLRTGGWSVVEIK